VNNVPKITSTPALGAAVGMPYSYTFTVADTNAGQTTTSTLITKPAGMTLIGNKISWTPTIQGSQQVTIKIADNIGDTSVQSFMVIVQPPTNIIHKNFSSSALVSRNVQPWYTLSGRAITGKSEGMRIAKNLKIISLH